MQSRLLAIDVGSSASKAIVVSGKQLHNEVRALACVQHPPGIATDHFDQIFKNLKSQLKRQLGRFGRLPDTTLLSLSHVDVITKRVAADPNQSADALEYSIGASLAGMLSVPVENIYFDFCRSDEAGALEQAFFDVFACRKDSVDPCLEALKKHGIEPSVIELQPHALMWLWKHVHENGQANLPAMLVDIGTSKTCCCFHPVVAPEYYREFSINFARARQRDMPVVNSPELEELISCLRRQINLHNSQYPTAPLLNLWLTGGGAGQLNPDVLKNALQIEVGWLEPARYMDISDSIKHEFSSGLNEFAVAAGLVMRGAINASGH